VVPAATPPGGPPLLQCVFFPGAPPARHQVRQQRPLQGILLLANLSLQQDERKRPVEVIPAATPLLQQAFFPGAPPAEHQVNETPPGGPPLLQRSPGQGEAADHSGALEDEEDEEDEQLV
jgi:hypothetical protein